MAARKTGVRQQFGEETPGFDILEVLKLAQAQDPTVPAKAVPPHAAPRDSPVALPRVLAENPGWTDRPTPVFTILCCEYDLNYKMLILNQM